MEPAQEQGEAPAGSARPAPQGTAPPGISLHDFCGRAGEQLVHFHAMRLRDSLFLWVGAEPALRSLAVAMCRPHDSIPVSTSLLGDASDTASNSLAQRLGDVAVNKLLAAWGKRDSAKFLPRVPMKIGSRATFGTCAGGC
ncbi:proteasome assembly chaperone 4 isoform X1 [Carettochelys insculpta]|uniref:proteasome assembly chaperone 4 isoform X1 n=1 Tax=Carettochelys insculpta TaxID=44489 RepID=UPI003EC117DA